jgi:uncharacterized protein (TIGR02145 family)
MQSEKINFLIIVLFCMELSGQLQTVKDVDSNLYKTVVIGTQTWMAENLKTTKYNDDTLIPYVIDNKEWACMKIPGYCWYDNNLDNKTTYGALYNWYTVNTNKLCPTGWHVPTDYEWSILEIYLQNNGYNFDGSIDTDFNTVSNNKIAKSLASVANWRASREKGAVGNTDYLDYRNKTGFAAIPGGWRLTIGEFSIFNFIGTDGYWWSATETEANISYAWYRCIEHSKSSMYGFGGSKNRGLSVRCIKD